MKPFGIAGVMLSLFCISSAHPADLEKLKVLYVGEPANRARCRELTDFLRTKVAKIEALDRRGFKQQQASEFDVVLLDWAQEGQQLGRLVAPLGERSTWSKPTVLLGSAGLNLAVAWKVRGGSG